MSDELRIMAVRIAAVATYKPSHDDPEDQRLGDWWSIRKIADDRRLPWIDGFASWIEDRLREVAGRVLAAPLAIDKAALVCVRDGVAHLFKSGEDGRVFLAFADDDWNFAAWNVGVEWHPARPAVEEKS